MWVAAVGGAGREAASAGEGAEVITLVEVWKEAPVRRQGSGGRMKWERWRTCGNVARAGASEGAGSGDASASER